MNFAAIHVLELHHGRPSELALRGGLLHIGDVHAPDHLKHLSYSDQLELLKSRSLVVDDEPLAIQHLERIGYYRLQSYLLPFRATEQWIDENGKAATRLLDEFRAGSEFGTAVQLYVFDKRLRLLIADAIERIEVALRVDLAHALGKRHPLAHLEDKFLDPSLKDRPDRHGEWLLRATKLESRSRLDWIEVSRRHGPLPVWKAVETWDLGILAELLEMAHRVDRAAIASKYGIPSAKLHSSWVRTLGYVRNITAHHSRLWNHPLVIQPMLPQSQVPALEHLSRYIPTQTRVYAAAAICQYFLTTISPRSTWKDRLAELWSSFPRARGIDPMHAGFLPNWKTWALWR